MHTDDGQCGQAAVPLQLCHRSATLMVIAASQPDPPRRIRRREPVIGPDLWYKTTGPGQAEGRPDKQGGIGSDASHENALRRPGCHTSWRLPGTSPGTEYTGLSRAHAPGRHPWLV